MVRRLTLTLLSLTLLFLTSFLLVGQINAQETEPGASGMEPGMPDRMIMPPYPGGSVTPFLGQSHFYSYVFRGNGEAVVTLKVVLANASESEDLEETWLRFPEIEPRDLTVYQIIGTGQCIRYDTPGFDAGNGGYRPPVCLEYGEPDYYGYYGVAKYQKADFTYEGDTLTVKLPRVLAPQRSGSFFVYFRSSDIADTTSFGGFSYNIETLKVDDEINQLTIGINTDSDLFLKGAKGEVDYRFAEADYAGLKVAPAGGEALASPAIDRFLGNIGYGAITKSASNLAPLESYKVEGAYAKSRFGLYAKETTIVVGVFVILLVVAIFVLRRVFSMLSGNGKEKSTKEVRGGGLFAISLGISFLCAIGMGLYTGMVIFAGSKLTEIVSYQYQPFITLFLVLISFCVYTFLLFAPGIFWGYKKGMGWGVGVILLTIAWLFIFFAVSIATIFFVGGGGGDVF